MLGHEDNYTPLGKLNVFARLNCKPDEGSQRFLQSRTFRLWNEIIGVQEGAWTVHLSSRMILLETKKSIIKYTIGSILEQYLLLKQNIPATTSKKIDWNVL